MSRVFVAHDTALNRRIVVKTSGGPVQSRTQGRRPPLWAVVTTAE
jgi:hypothetical protein